MVQNWCHDHFERFWPKTYWPPCSPDLNFLIWSILARKAGENTHKTLESLKLSIQEARDDLDAETVRKYCNSAYGRIEAVVEANGGYIKK